MFVVLGHRAHTVYVGVHVPARRSHRRRKHPPRENGEKGSQDSQERPSKFITYKFYNIVDLLIRSSTNGYW